MQPLIKNRILAVLVGKAILFFTAAVYLLSLPFYYILVALPGGTADFLLPYESVLCVCLSGVFFAWTLHSAYKILGLVTTQ